MTTNNTEEEKLTGGDSQEDQEPSEDPSQSEKISGNKEIVEPPVEKSADVEIILEDSNSRSLNSQKEIERKRKVPEHAQKKQSQEKTQQVLNGEENEKVPTGQKVVVEEKQQRTQVRQKEQDGENQQRTQDGEKGMQVEIVTYGDALRKMMYMYYNLNHKKEISYFQNSIFPYFQHHASHGKFGVELTSWSKDDEKEIYDEIMKNANVYKAIFHHEGIKLEVITKSVSMTRGSVTIQWLD